MARIALLSARRPVLRSKCAVRSKCTGGRRFYLRPEHWQNSPGTTGLRVHHPNSHESGYSSSELSRVRLLIIRTLTSSATHHPNSHEFGYSPSELSRVRLPTIRTLTSSATHHPSSHEFSYRGPKPESAGGLFKPVICIGLRLLLAGSFPKNSSNRVGYARFGWMSTGQQ